MTEQKSQVHNKRDRQASIRDLRIKGLAEQEHGSQHSITKKLARMHADVQTLLQQNS